MAAFCQATVALDRVQKLVLADPSRETHTMHAAMVKTWTTLASRLGLTPVDRVRLGVPAPR